jgi:adenylyltransferase/sulfurtransferase
MLVRAGIGRLQIVDRDFVEESNLQRQSLFTELDVQQGLPKSIAAERALKAINSQVEVVSKVTDLSWENIEAVLGDVDIVVDGCDNFETRFLLNDFCVHKGKPWIYGAALGSYGLSWTIRPERSPCLRCLFPDPPEFGASETCETAGILAPVVHAVSAFQVSQLLRWAVGETGRSHMLQVDVWKDVWRTRLLAEPVQACPACQGRSFPYLRGERSSVLTRLCGRNAVQIRTRRKGSLDLDRLAKRLGPHHVLTANEYLLKAEVAGLELVVFSDGRAIVKGTDDFAAARSCYSRWVGD